MLDFDMCGWIERVTSAFVLVCCRLTKPLSFADCVGDELPWGWEAGFDPQIGVYYIDHINSEYFLFGTNKHVRQVIPPNLESYRRANALQNEFLYFKPSLSIFNRNVHFGSFVGLTGAERERGVCLSVCLSVCLKGHQTLHLPSPLPHSEWRASADMSIVPATYSLYCPHIVCRFFLTQLWASCGRWLWLYFSAFGCFIWW